MPNSFNRPDYEERRVAYQVDVTDSVGTYRCKCCVGGTVEQTAVGDDDESVKLDLSRLPWWVWVLVFATPVLIWLFGGLLFLLGRLCKAKAPAERIEHVKTEVDSEQFEFPFGSRFLLRVEAIVHCEKSGSACGFLESLLQHKTNFLRVEKNAEGAAQFAKLDVIPYLKLNSGAYSAYRAWCGPKAPFKGLSQAGWRVKLVFNFLFGLALSIAFGSVALDMESKSTCNVDCYISDSSSCNTNSASSTSVSGGSLEMPEGTGLYMTQTALFIAVINMPTTAGTSFLLKRSFRIGSICLGFVSILVLATGLAAVAGSIFYLVREEGSSTMGVSTKIMFCIILKIGGMIASVFALGVLVNMLLFYLPAYLLLKKYLGLAAAPRDRSKEKSSIIGKAASAAAANMVALDIGSESNRGRSASELMDAAAVAAKAAAFCAAKNAALLKLKAKLQPRLKKEHGLRWEDVEPHLRSIELKDCEEALENPEPLIARILVSAATIIAIAKLRPRLEPVAKKHGVAWEDLLPVLQAVDSVEELQAAAEDPEGFLLRIADAATPAAKALAIAKLRPKLEPLAKKRGLTWEDLLPVLELVDSVEELQAAVNDPEAFLLRMADAASHESTTVSTATTPQSMHRPSALANQLAALGIKSERSTMSPSARSLSSGSSQQSVGAKTVPMQPMPVAQPVQTMPVAQPVQPMPVAQPVQPMPVAQPMAAQPQEFFAHV